MERSYEKLMYGLLSKAEEINVLGTAVLERVPGVFGQISQIIPRLHPRELGFLKLVSRLFSLYYEAGRVGVAFLMDRFPAYALDQGGIALSHYSLIQKMRTYLQHNLDLRETHDLQIVQECQAWFTKQCDTALPDNESRWAKCLAALLRESSTFLETLLITLRQIEKDESRLAIRDDWQLRVIRYHPPQEFDEIIPQIAADMGRENLDFVAFRKRFHDRWIQSLRGLTAEYDFKIEARKLIEDALLRDVTSVLPITGHDLMAEFNLGPGRLIGNLLAEARKIYEQTPCSRERLFERLRPLAAELQIGAPPTGAPEVGSVDKAAK